jgi:hypothetical protein
MVELSQRDVVPLENVKFEFESTVSYVGVSKIEDYFFLLFSVNRTGKELLYILISSENCFLLFQLG